MPFAVLLGRLQDSQSPVTADAVAAVRKIPRVDAARAVRTAFGIIAEDLAETDARDLVAALQERSVPAYAVAEERLASLPPVTRAQSAVIADGGFTAVLADGRRGLIAWPNLALVCFHGQRVSTLVEGKKEAGPTIASKMMRATVTMTTGIPLPSAKKKAPPKPVEQVENAYALDLFTKQPAARVRIPTQPFDFSCLGPQKAPAALTNLVALVRLITERAPQAPRNTGTQILLDKRPIAGVAYDSPRDLDRECRWLLTLGSVQ